MEQGKVGHFRRVFPSGEFFSSLTLRSILWSTLSTALLLVQLGVVYLFLGLLLFGGRIAVGQPDFEEFSRRTGVSVPSPTQSYYSDDDAGLVPFAWEKRKYLIGRVLLPMCRYLPPMRQDTTSLLTLVGLFIFLQLLRSGATSCARSLCLQKSVQIATNLRLALHRQNLRLGPSDLEGQIQPQALDVFVNQVDRVRDAVYRHTLVLSRDPLRLAVILVVVVLLEPLMTLLCVVPLLGCGYLAMLVISKSTSARKLAEAHADRELKLLSEDLAKTKLIKAFAMEGYEQRRFEQHLRRYQTERVRALTAGRGFRVLAQLAAVLCLGLILTLFGVQQLRATDSTTFINALLLALSLGLAWVPVYRLYSLWTAYEADEDAARQINNWLDKVPEVEQVVGARFLQPLSRMLEFDKVTYSSGRRNLLDGVTLKIPAGRQVAIIASDAREGQALATLLPRFIEPQSGRILYDGEDIAWTTLESLRAETIFVGAKDPFLTGSVRENLAGGDDKYSLSDVSEAAKIVHAHQFISKLPQSYESMIGEHGEQLDPGQAFMIGLARAALRKPALLVIEEPTEQLDDNTKALLDDAYNRLAQKRTVIYLPQRLATIKRCDEIVFLHRGKVVAIGPHARLVQSSPLYRHWEYVKFNEFRNEFETE